MDVPFLPVKNLKPMKVGNSYYFKIPSQYVFNGAIRLNRFYSLVLSSGLDLGLKKVSKKVGCFVFLIDADFINRGSVKVSKVYKFSLFLGLKSKESNN